MINVSDTSFPEGKLVTPRRFGDARDCFSETWTKPKTAAAGLDVAVDVRIGSPTYLKWVSAELSAKTGAQLLVPRGFLHGFLTLQPDTEVLYKVDNPYSADADGAVRFDDATLGVDWGIDTAKAVMSDKDAAAPAFADFDNPFTYEAAS